MVRDNDQKYEEVHAQDKRKIIYFHFSNEAHHGDMCCLHANLGTTPQPRFTHLPTSPHASSMLMSSFLRRRDLFRC